MFRKVLVANRGEIAVRIIRALREAGIASVAVYSDADRASLAVLLADEAAHIGPAPSSESYLSIEKILAAAKYHDADAIHPGYGFLSENADFAEACKKAGIVFIGPPAEAIRKMGSKTSARQIAIAAGAPVVPGTERALASVEEAHATASTVGYPVLLKAAAGGGGKGMRRVDSEDHLEGALRDARSEAARAFGNDEVYIEKLVVEPRHIEIQILGDHHGNLIHLGERECSLQRRHQKVIEECPSPVMLEHPDLRDRMGEAALKIARAAGYANAGTLEFLVDRDRNFYFLEMNTRLQVEHPVTELVTGLDLVQWQLRIAQGERLTVRQEDVDWRGHAVECRVYAEDPDHDFLPFPGKIENLAEPSGPGIRLDSGVYAGWNVPLDYDPLLAKLAAWAPTRDAAIRRLDRALAEYVLTGIRTNIQFFREILKDPEFAQGRLSTAFIEAFFARRPQRVSDPSEETAAALVAAALAVPKSNGAARARPQSVVTGWPGVTVTMSREVLIDGRPTRLPTDGFSVEPAAPGTYSVIVEGKVYRVTRGSGAELQVNGRTVSAEVFDPRDRRAGSSAALNHGVQQVAASMPGRVVRVLVSKGDQVEEGQGLVVVEAMKMQNELKSPKSGRVAELRVLADATVSAGQVLVIVE